VQFPFIVHIADQSILLHGICEFIGIFMAFRYYLFLRRRSGDHVASGNRIYIITAAAFGAVVGSRIIGASEDIGEWIHTANKWQYFYGNKTLVGGLLGGLLAVELTKKLIGEKQNTGDLFVFPLLLGMMIGRIGCFSAGIYEETYGLRSGVPWAMDLGDGIPRHPVTLYEILFLMVVWLSLAFIRKNYSLRQGALFKLFMIAYLSFRFSLDFIKPHKVYFLNFGTIQLTCLIGLLYYVKYIIQPHLLFTKKSFYAG
jgi:prolipoprotein diacylglyceryltransferase